MTFESTYILIAAILFLIFGAVWGKNVFLDLVIKIALYLMALSGVVLFVRMTGIV